MDKIIPALPCPDIHAQVEFYKHLGFELIELFSRPNAYAVMKYNELELHFYGKKRLIPSENSTTCIAAVSNVDEIYSMFINGLKNNTGKIPRSGIPRISKVRDLIADRRFTLTDTGGNTFYFCTQIDQKTIHFFRTLNNPLHSEKFALLYDLLYSKEDYKVASNYLPKVLEIKNELNDLDNAKVLLVSIEIKYGLHMPIDDIELELQTLMNSNQGDDWDRIKKKYLEMIARE